MNDNTLREAYGELLGQRAGSRTDCASPESLLAVVNGEASEAERLATLRHVASCRECRSELELLRTARDAAEHTARPAWQSVPLLAAAASVLLLATSVAVWSSLRTRQNDVLRESPAAAVTLLAPSPDSAFTLPITLIWAAVPDARRYEIEILRANGSVVFMSSSRDTTLVVPVQNEPVAGDYRWWVRAVLTDGTTVRSPLRRLRLATP